MIKDVTNDFISGIMRTDIKEREGQFLLEIELPGYQKENITAQLEEGKLTIIAVRNEELAPADVQINYIMKERKTGEIKRSFMVGDGVRQADITAALKDGILSIIIAKSELEVEGEKRKLIPIQ